MSLLLFRIVSTLNSENVMLLLWPMTGRTGVIAVRRLAAFSLAAKRLLSRSKVLEGWTLVSGSFSFFPLHRGPLQGCADLSALRLVQVEI